MGEKGLCTIILSSSVSVQMLRLDKWIRSCVNVWTATAPVKLEWALLKLQTPAVLGSSQRTMSCFSSTNILGSNKFKSTKQSHPVETLFLFQLLPVGYHVGTAQSFLSVSSGRTLFTQFSHPTRNMMVNMLIIVSSLIWVLVGHVFRYQYLVRDTCNFNASLILLRGWLGSLV